MKLFKECEFKEEIECLNKDSKAYILFKGYEILFEMILDDISSKTSKLEERKSFLDKLYPLKDPEYMDIENKIWFIFCYDFFSGVSFKED